MFKKTNKRECFGLADVHADIDHLQHQNLLLIGFCCCPGQVLLKNMLKPLVMYASLSVRVSEQQGEGTILALQCLEENHEERSTPSQVYNKLLLVLKTLHSHLLGKYAQPHVEMKGEKKKLRGAPFLFAKAVKGKSRDCCFSDVSIEDKKLSAILGELIWEEMSQCIIRECLVYSIPTNSSQLDKYSTVQTKRFLHHCQLIKVKFSPNICMSVCSR